MDKYKIPVKYLLEITIPGLPPSVNKMHGRNRFGHTFLRPEVRAYQQKMMNILLKRPQLDFPLILLIEFHMRTKEKYSKRDTDNAIKIFQDGLSIAGQIKNDNKIIFVAAMKILDTKNFSRAWIYKLEPDAKNIFDVFRNVAGS